MPCDNQYNVEFLIVDLFCGAGGVTTGFTMAESVNLKVIACVNHDHKAIQSHWSNHPDVKHFEEDIRTLDLTELKSVVNFQQSLYPNAKLILWASLECTNFSKAKGGKPRNADSRTLADHLHRYVDALHPDFVMIENVVEFMSWGPLDKKGKPVSHKNGQDFMRWCREMNSHGYKNDWRELNSADFGARQSRNRLFGQFIRPDQSFVWPDKTHAKNPNASGLFEGLKKHQPCRPCLELEDKGTSIFTPGKIKSEKTFERIFAGLVKFVAGMKQKEFISKYYSGKPDGKNISLDGPAGTITTSPQQAIVSCDFLMKYNSAATNGDMQHSVLGIDQPCPTIPAQRAPSLVQTCFISNYYSNGDNNHSVENPCPTLRTGDGHALVSTDWIDRQFTSGSHLNDINQPCGSLLPVPKMNLVQAQFLMNPQYMNSGGSIDAPSFTLIARMDKMPPYLVQVESGEIAIKVFDSDCEAVRKIKRFMAMYGIYDIKMRMLKVSELKRLQGFPEDYKLVGNQADQKKFIGNSVVPLVVKVWIEAIAKHTNHRYTEKCA